MHIKALLMFLSAAIFPAIAVGQIDIENKTHPVDSNLVVFSTFFNHIEIRRSPVSGSDLKIKAENGEVVMDENDPCRFWLRVKSRYKPVYLNFYYGDSLLLKERLYVDADIRLPGISMGCSVMPEQGEILCRGANSLICTNSMKGDTLNRKVTFEVVSCQVYIIRLKDSVDYNEYQCGRYFSTAAKAFISTLKYRDQMLLNHIIVRDMYGNYYKIPGKGFVVSTDGLMD